MSNAIVQIRDYTINTEWFDDYKEWQNLVGPWLKENLDFIDCWLDEGLESEVGGFSPISFS